MDNFDKVYSYLTEEEGLSPEDASRAMVMMVEQGFDPTQVFLGGLAKMLDFLPKKKVNPVDAAAKQPPAPKPAFSSVGTTTVKPQQGPALSTRVAPAPQFGGSPQAQDIKRLNQLTKGPIGDKTIQKPVVSSGRMGKPQGPSLSTNVAPKPNFSTVKPTLPKPSPSLFGKLKNIATGIRSAAGPAIAQSIGLELSTKLAQSAGRPGQSKLSRLGALPGRSEYAPVYKTPLNTDAFEKPQQKISEPKKPEVTGDALYIPRTPKSQPVQKSVEPVSTKQEPTPRKKVVPPVARPAAKPADPEVQRYRELIKQGKRLEAETLGKEIYQRKYGAPAFAPKKTA